MHILFFENVIKRTDTDMLCSFVCFKYEKMFTFAQKCKQCVFVVKMI